VLAIVVLAGCAVLAAMLDSPPPPVAGRGQVSDGDSFRLGDDRVRLLGLDAPELAQQCSAPGRGQWPCGRIARDRMAALLAGGAVDCRPEGVDQYARLLAQCSVGGVDIARVMVSEGLAVAAGRYSLDEAQARQRGDGIWAGGFVLPADWRRDHARPQGFSGWLAGIGL
jgi:endonuclease YncB( thermonuclease family)